LLILKNTELVLIIGDQMKNQITEEEIEWLEEKYQRYNIRGQGAILRYLIYNGIKTERLMRMFNLSLPQLIEAIDNNQYIQIKKDLEHPPFVFWDTNSERRI